MAIGNAFLASTMKDVLHDMSEGGRTFRIMVVGEGGLGKSTLVACLLQVAELKATLDIYNDDSQAWETVMTLPGGNCTQQMRRYRYRFEENHGGIIIQSCYDVIDTPGFASSINNDNSWHSKMKVIETGLKAFGERGPTDRTDPRVHICLYLLSPNPRPLKELDKRVMIELQRIVPVLPVIAKADSFDVETLSSYQELLQEEFAKHGIKTLDMLEDFPLKLAQAPLAIIASSRAYKPCGDGGWAECDISDREGKLGRLYRWGLASCEESSDLSLVRRVLLECRHFILKQCDGSWYRWSQTRDQLINAIAKALADEDAYSKALAEYNSTCCPPRQPQLGLEQGNVSAIHKDKAEKLWAETFHSSFATKAQLSREVSMHSQVEPGPVQLDLRDTLVKIYSERLLDQAPSCGQADARFPAFLCGRLRVAITSGTVRKIILSFVDSLVAEKTGFPRGVVKDVVKGLLAKED